MQNESKHASGGASEACYKDQKRTPRLHRSLNCNIDIPDCSNGRVTCLSLCRCTMTFFHIPQSWMPPYPRRVPTLRIRNTVRRYVRRARGTVCILSQWRRRPTFTLRALCKLKTAFARGAEQDLVSHHRFQDSSSRKSRPITLDNTSRGAICTVEGRNSAAE